MEKLSSYLEELSTRAKAIEQKISTYKDNTQKQQGNMLQEAKAQAKAQKKEFLKRVAELDKATQAFWMDVQNRYYKSVKKRKKDFDSFKDKVKAKDAEKYAAIAAEDAEASVLFVLHSIASAEKSVIKALNARALADSLKNKP